MKLKSISSDKVLTIYLPEKIDTSNADEVESAINEEINKQENIELLILDGEVLTYISSVGLRIILRLKKRFENLRIINVTNEAYDVFEMTGFVDIIKIRKSFRTISVEGCPLIGQGFYGKVYRINPDTIVKVYFRGTGINEVEKERTLAKKAFVLGIPTAISYDIVKVKEGGYFGTVFELLDAASLDSLIINHPENLDSYIKMYINLLRTISSTEVYGDDLPKAKDAIPEYLNVIENSLNSQLFSEVKALLDTIPNTNKLVHGDCHIKNIFVQNGEPILIDMETISSGHQIFDLSALYLTYVGYELTDPGNSLKFLGVSTEVSQKLYYSIFHQIFYNKTEEEIEEIVEKCRVLGYVILLYRTILFDKDNEARINLCKSELSRLVKKLKTLEF